VRTLVAGWQIKLVGQDPKIDGVHIFGTDAELAVLAARARRKDVVVALPELIDGAGPDGVDMRKLAFEHEGTDHEIMVRMHVVAATGAVKDFVAEHADWAKARTAALIVVEVEARLARDEAIGMAGDIGRAGSVGANEVVTALVGAQNERRSWCTGWGPQGG
jgi:hypothetical protein